MIALLDPVMTIPADAVRVKTIRRGDKVRHVTTGETGIVWAVVLSTSYEMTVNTLNGYHWPWGECEVI